MIISGANNHVSRKRNLLTFVLVVLGNNIGYLLVFHLKLYNIMLKFEFHA